MCHVHKEEYNSTQFNYALVQTNWGQIHRSLMIGSMYKEGYLDKFTYYMKNTTCPKKMGRKMVYAKQNYKNLFFYV